MKKRHSIHVILAAAALLLAMAACTKDELADGDRLPEGQYPLEIARITLGVEGGEAQPWGAPATRVSEKEDGNSSKFDADDKFAVQIDDKGEVGTYTVQNDGSVEAETPLYWSDRDEAHTVTAWYPATGGTLDLSDQSQSLAYLLGGSGTGDYQTPVTLTFAHRLAKVRVTPTGDALGEVQSLQLYTYTQCTYEKGKAGQGSQEGWIEMKKCEYTENGATITCWEANVVPGYTITKLQANGTEERNLSAAITPEAGKFYNITLNKDKGYTDDGQGNYTVTSAEGLKNIAKLVNEEWKLGINITLTADIDLKGIDWTPIGKDDNKAYTGTFDGNGKTITGLTVTGSYKYAGLFGDIDENGTVKNVVLEGVQITSDNSSGYAGGVAGDSWGTIENCSVSGSVSGTTFAGGVVGSQRGGSITGCNSSATVKGVIFAGGIAGETNSGASLTGCYATGDVTVENDGTNNSHAGGVVGYNGGGTLTACYATGSVTGSGSGTIYVGGVTGSNNFGILTACYHAKEDVSGPTGTTGGVAGRNFKGSMSGGGIITACYWGGNGQEQGIGEDQVGTGGTTQVTDGNWSGAKDAMNDALTAENESWRYQINLVNSLLELTQNQ
ncbi:fimbrillin family protein [Mediterranea massiliensis]|uniref:Fimbrillin family protein n=1 Tax=Mediterranea massiliensis TaxID=1841865 RepID=A0ABS2E0X2_9BACT|nr:GLUG motif-containing protein [Mediterranea massiliensis]MBM6735253.1 fimbrillin family protein [Mediterranea massiliensis]